MRNEIINNINKIINDINIYKNKKDLIKLITRIDNILENKKNNILIKILNEMSKKIIEIDENDDKINKINIILNGFLKNNKTYISKKEINNYYIYEYTWHYSIYINNNQKKINEIIEFINNTFKKNQIIKIDIDGSKWNNIGNITNDDIKKSKKIKIDIEK